MADRKWYDEGTRPQIVINWQSFEDWGIPSNWKNPFLTLVINAYTRWNNMSGVDMRFQLKGYTTRTSPENGELLIKMNERHANSSRLASTFGSYGKLEIVFHRKRGSDLTPWNFVVWYNNPSEFDMYTILLHEMGHCLGLDHSTNSNEVMIGGYAWHHRFGLYKEDVNRLQNVFNFFTKNRLRQLKSSDGGNSWSTVSNNLTSHSSNDARTNINPAVAPTPNSGLYVLGYSSLNQKPIYIRGVGNYMFTNQWWVYGGENSILSPAFASDRSNNMIYAWVDNDDNGSIKLVRSTNHGYSWFNISEPAGANTYGTPALCWASINGQSTWILLWSNLDRSNRSNTGYIYYSISTNNGGSWSESSKLDGFYKVLSGVSAASDGDNNIVVTFSWAPNSDLLKYKINQIRTFKCKVEEGELKRKSTILSPETTRIQPGITYDHRNAKFILAWRGQNYQTTLNTMTKSRTGSSWGNKIHLSDKRSHTAPALAYSRENNETVMWYVYE